MTDLRRRQDELARRIIELTRQLNKTHDEREDNHGRMGNKKDPLRKKAHSSVDEDDESDIELNNLKEPRLRVANNNNDIQEFKRIHTLIRKRRLQFLVGRTEREYGMQHPRKKGSIFGTFGSA
jgi:hypothetical protein